MDMLDICDLAYGAARLTGVPGQPALAVVDLARVDWAGSDPRAAITALAGSEFAAWRAQTPVGAVPSGDEPVLLERVGDVLTVTLNRPERHNAFGRAVRDGLIDALEVAHLDPTIAEVVLTGAGRSFCSGGDLDEFGTAADPVAAHLVCLARSADWAIHRVRDRMTARVHGACIGAGVEVVPGAGGTVSITRRIGRWLTSYLALSGARLDAGTALEWGLVDGIV